MPENFITMLGILTIFLLSGFVFGCLFARSRSRKALQAMEEDLENKVKSARGELSLEFAAELGSLRSNLLGVARSYDGALRLIKENLPEDIDLSRSLADGNHVPAELGFGSARPGAPRKATEDQAEVQSESERLHKEELHPEEVHLEQASDLEPESFEKTTAPGQQEPQSTELKSNPAGLDETALKQKKVEPSEDSKVQTSRSTGSVEQSSIYLANSDFADGDFSDGDFADKDSSDNLKNGRVSSR